MPKKTKKEKIIAEARRMMDKASQRQIVSLSHSMPTEHTTVNQPRSFVFTPQAVPKISQEDDAYMMKEYKAIRLDLAKTVLLAAGAVCLELIAYWRFRIG